MLLSASLYVSSFLSFFDTFFSKEYKAIYRGRKLGEEVLITMKLNILSLIHPNSCTSMCIITFFSMYVHKHESLGVCLE